jgi:uncharacterized protein with NRDE domain
MCIVAVALGGSSRIDFLLANNRDESLDRPTVAASAASVGADSSQNGFVTGGREMREKKGEKKRKRKKKKKTAPIRHDRTGFVTSRAPLP